MVQLVPQNTLKLAEIESKYTERRVSGSKSPLAFGVAMLFEGGFPKDPMSVSEIKPQAPGTIPEPKA